MTATELSSSVRSWHTVFDGGVRWRLVDAGVEIEDSGVERTKGNPNTVTRVWQRFADGINVAARKYQLPCELIVATICTESGGDETALRLEPGYSSDETTPNKVSPGLMQTLISTAREALQMSLDRDWLLQPKNSIRAGTAYIAKQRRITGFDPPLVAAAYNAGRIARNPGAQNRWKLRQYPIGTGAHCDRFVRFYNDAVVVLAQASVTPVVRHQSLLQP
jgi:Transglycosylase SLT domain